MFIAAFLKGITGLGFSTICLGMLANIIPLPVAIPMVIIPSLSSNVIVMVQVGHFRPTLFEFKWLYLTTLPGLAIGLTLLGSVPTVQTTAALGAVLIAYAIFALVHSEFRLSERVARYLQVPVGFTTGIVNGATGSQVMPVLPYLLSLSLSPDRLVQAINISFTASSLVMMAGLAHLGLLDTKILLASCLAIIPVYIGIKLGGALQRKLPEKGFRIAVLILLIVFGVNLIRGFFAI
tara:strand:+ start:1246 stop:1953 length:708 start_codon:yes stop_codon:yes gene_type:complete